MPLFVVLDPSNLLRGVSDTLTQNGVEICYVECVISAMEVSRQRRAELIICVDAHLPRLNALDLLELKGADPYLQTTAVVVLSTSLRNKATCYSLGCDDFIALPTDESELLFRICSVLRRNAPALEGSFLQFSLPDVVQMLLAAQQTGQLVIRGGKERGWVMLEKGQIVSARTESSVGENAFYALLWGTQNDGSFSFVPGELTGLVKNIQKRTDHLLLELAGRLDESR